MNYVIYGAGEFGKNLAINMPKNDGLYCFTDKNIFGTEALGKAVVSLNELKYLHDNEKISKVIVAISNYYELGDAILELYDLGIRKLNYVDPVVWNNYWINGIDCDDLFTYIYQVDEEKKAVITKLEYHICDNCNLNCVGCSHFAPIYGKTLVDIENFKKDIHRLGELFSNILRFRLMGGEPFLNSDLDEFVFHSRKEFPNAHLEIVTNGLYLDRVKDKIWDVIKEYNAFLNISLYPPTFDRREQIEDTLKKYNIQYTFGSGLEQYNEDGIINEFHKNLTIGRDNNPQIAASKCMGNRCHFLRDGKIAKCAIPLLAKDINSYFGSNYDVCKDDYVDIYDDSVSPWDMVRKLRYATPFCAYCSETGPQRFNWAVGRDVAFKDYVILGERE